MKSKEFRKIVTDTLSRVVTEKRTIIEAIGEMGLSQEDALSIVSSSIMAYETSTKRDLNNKERELMTYLVIASFMMGYRVKEGEDQHNEN